MRALDLFAGTGWGVACRELDIEELGVDNWQPVIDTRAANGMSTVFTDAWDGLRSPTLVPKHDLLIASPPCQTFTLAGSGAGRRALGDVLRLIAERAYLRVDDMLAFAREHGDERTALVLAPLAYATRFRPQAVVLEQVPPVLPVWEAYAEELRLFGYSAVTGVLHAEQYGVPQTRNRAVLIARLDGEARMPTPTHSRYHTRTPTRLDAGVQKWVSMAEALPWAGEDLVGFPRRADEYATSIGEVVTLGGEEYRGRDLREADLPAWNLTSKSRSWSRWTFNDQSGAPYDPDWPSKRPATTIAKRGLVQNPGHTRSRHDVTPTVKSRNLGVVVTLEEAAQLQTYPEGFRWAGSRTASFQQVGNAVPPLFGQHILEAAIS